MAKFSDMTARERWDAALRHKKPDRLPMDYRSTNEFTEKLLKHTDSSTLSDFCEKYHIDMWKSIGPRYTGKASGPGTDSYGCRYAWVNYNGGRYHECVYNPLAEYKTVDEIEKNYEWPETECYDYSRISGEVNENKTKPMMVGGWEPFLFYKYLRGDEQSYVDLIENPEICRYIMDKLFEASYGRTERTLAAAGGNALLASSSEDLGGQTGLMYSPKHIKEFFLPLHKKMIDMMHSYGVFVMWHTDGAAREILPDLVEIGIDMLDPVQWRCPGMEREGLVNDFGGRLVFHGSIDNQFTLPFGTIENVRDEVFENFGIFGKNGGYIMGPCHNLQPVGPAENAVAMYEAGYECKY